ASSDEETTDIENRECPLTPESSQSSVFSTPSSPGEIADELFSREFMELPIEMSPEASPIEIRQKLQISPIMHQIKPKISNLNRQEINLIDGFRRESIKKIDPITGGLQIKFVYTPLEHPTVKIRSLTDLQQYCNRFQQEIDFNNFIFTLNKDIIGETSEKGNVTPLPFEENQMTMTTSSSTTPKGAM
ncbi:hypothetical protein CHUAL_000044, partial [Chamberlinius hualienensis]